MDCPATIETERLILRPWRTDDFEGYAQICADPEVMRYLGGKPLSRLEVWRSMAFHVGHWGLLGFGHWAVEEKSSRAFIGRIGFLNPEGWPGFEIGWTLSRANWGKGYATEGATRALEIGFGSMGREHIISLIQPDNRASIRVAERLGEKVEGRTELFGNEVLIYGIDRNAWASAVN